MHQIHFLVLSQNHFEINGTLPIQDFQGQFLDTVQVPIWDGISGHPFPAVTLRMDFRGSDVGDFVYHCHIAGQEDGEMMAIIRVLPRSPDKVKQETRGHESDVESSPASTEVGRR